MASGNSKSANIKTTRLELIKTKARIKLAKKGVELLKMKRKKLVFTFFDIVRQIKLSKTEVKTTLERAIESTKIAEMIEGRLRLEMIAEEQSRMDLELSASNVMGIMISQVNWEEEKKGKVIDSVLSLPLAIGDVRLTYLELFRIIIDISQKEMTLRKLLKEIQKLNMRVNAIDYNILPTLNDKARFIKQKLDDFERDRTVSLKYIKARIGT